MPTGTELCARAHEVCKIAQISLLSAHTILPPIRFFNLHTTFVLSISYNQFPPAAHMLKNISSRKSSLEQCHRRNIFSSIKKKIPSRTKFVVPWIIILQNKGPFRSSNITACLNLVSQYHNTTRCETQCCFTTTLNCSLQRVIEQLDALTVHFCTRQNPYLRLALYFTLSFVCL